MAFINEDLHHLLGPPPADRTVDRSDPYDARELGTLRLMGAFDAAKLLEGTREDSEEESYYTDLAVDLAALAIVDLRGYQRAEEMYTARID